MKVLSALGIAALCCTGTAQGALITTGTVNYDGADRKLIYDTDLDVTWLDYTHFGQATWYDQMAWAEGLSFEIGGVTYDNWRLPTGTQSWGFNQTGAEIGHLYYYGLGLSSVTVGWQTSATLNAGEFDNLIATLYWSGTEYAGHPDFAWHFNFAYGSQGYYYKGDPAGYGLAVLPGQIAPEPGTMVLLGTGMVGLVGLMKRRSR